jgi:hypothetical protein
MSQYFPDGGYSGEEPESLKPVPPGRYLCEAIEGSVGPPKTGNGMMLSLTWKVLDGDYEGRQFWQHISFLHPKPGAQYHGQRKLNAIIAAVSATVPLDTVEPLLFKPVWLTLDIEKSRDPRYPDDKNTISRIEPHDGEAKEAAAHTAPHTAPNNPPPTQRVPNENAPPWRRD